MMNPKKIIAVVIHEPSLSGANLGLLETLKGLDEHYRFIFIVPGYGTIIPRLNELKGTLEIIVQDYRWWMSNRLPRFKFYKSRMTVRNFIGWWDIVKKLRKRNIEFILSNTIVINIGVMIARSLGVKHVWYIHEYGVEDHGLSFLYGSGLSIFLMRKFGGTVFTNSLALSRHFTNKLHREIPYVYYPVLMDDKYDIRTKKIGGSAILYGRITRSKGHHLAIEAVKILKQKGIVLRLTIMGSAEDEVYLKELGEYIIRNGINEEVRFIPHRNDPFEEVQQHEIVLNCSLSEAFGRMNIEGMKLGAIVIASDSGASPELIKDGETGFLFEPGNADALAEVLRHVHSMPFAEKEQIAENGRKYAATVFTLQEHTRQVLNIISG